MQHQGEQTSALKINWLKLGNAISWRSIDFRKTCQFFLSMFRNQI